MNIDNIIKNLFKNRLMRDDKEIDEFEESLGEINHLSNVDYIAELCKVFDDKTEHHEVMWGLVHLIESFDAEFGSEQTLKQIIKATPYMLNTAKEWIKILNHRILNDEPSRIAFSKSLCNTEEDTKHIVLNLLDEIKQEDSHKFEVYVNEVFKIAETD